MDEKRAELQKLILTIRKDFDWYRDKNLRINDSDGDNIEFNLNPGQQKLWDRVKEDEENGQPVRYIILKARKVGFSTFVEGYNYWKTATQANKRAVILAHKSSSSETIYKMFQTFHNNVRDEFQPKTKYSTKLALVFDDKEGKGLGSSVSIATAGASGGGVGRGDTIHYLHCSEVGFYPNAADIVSGIMQAVPTRPNTSIFLESTANGVGNWFYEEWKAAERGESSFKPFFYAWHEHPDYMLETRPLSVYTKYEKKLLVLFEEAGYPEEEWDKKIAWYRAKAKEFRQDPKLMLQEYPSWPEEAFIASGRPVFDFDKLKDMLKLAEEQPKKVYFIDTAGYHAGSSKEDFEGNYKVWSHPQPGRQYVIGVDVSEGIDEGKRSDYSVVTIMDKDSMATVARYRDKIDPDLLAELVKNLGLRYNEALVGVEINNHGLTVVQGLRNRQYWNLYMRELGAEEWNETPSSRMGWKTTSKSKPVMIDALSAAIRDGLITDYDEEFIRECMTYVRDSRGRTNAQQGQHDDIVMSTAVALQLFQWGIEKRHRENLKPYYPIRRRR